MADDVDLFHKVRESEEWFYFSSREKWFPVGEGVTLDLLKILQVRPADAVSFYSIRDYPSAIPSIRRSTYIKAVTKKLTTTHIQV